MPKNDSLETIAAEVIICQKCPLSKTRKNAVPGEGNPNTQVMFIGEAPGYWEDIKGRPFVGDAGKFLDSLLSEIRFSREDVFIGNVLKCRPPGNREPQPSEVQACTSYLDRQIKAIQPRILVTLGNHSTAYIFSKSGLAFTSITKVHGKFYDVSLLGMKVTVFSTFHPAAALYHPKYKQQIIEDFKLLKERLEKERTITH
ncbi:MAG: type-4 uracil-DNA glycosylase [Candidatus Bathyarchaeota archaeon]|nr:uracil-DNA glycosylase [Candidatus Bathyarchaeota archaeon A05DMB-5]MDH7557422.1 type-4 uracil-DNA glycosylase [Candidatus Bathyarchaeota archaeon]